MQPGMKPLSMLQDLANCFRSAMSLTTKLTKLKSPGLFQVRFARRENYKLQMLRQFREVSRAKDKTIQVLFLQQKIRRHLLQPKALTRKSREKSLFFYSIRFSIQECHQTAL